MSGAGVSGAGVSGAGVSRVEPRARAAKRDPRVAPPFRMVWTCRQERSIVTFTEGDLVLCVAADDAAYTTLHAEHRAFYREH